MFGRAITQVLNYGVSRQKIFTMGEDSNGLPLAMESPQNREIIPQTMYLGPGSTHFRQYQVNFEKLLDSNRILTKLTEKDNRSSGSICKERSKSKQGASKDSKVRPELMISSISKSSSAVEIFKEKSRRTLSPVELGVIKGSPDQLVQTRRKSGFYKENPFNVSNPLDDKICQQTPESLFESQSTPDQDLKL